MSTMMEMFGGAAGQSTAPSVSIPANPIQRMQMVMNAMRNPAAYIKQRFPDIPDQYMNNPNLIMQYLQQTRGISNQDIQNARNQMTMMANPQTK